MKIKNVDVSNMTKTEASEVIDNIIGKTWEDVMKSIKDKETWFEKYIEYPLYRHVWTPINNFYYGLYHLPRNIKRFFKVVWNYRTWDYQYTLDILKVALEGQLECLENTKTRGWSHTLVDRDIKDLKITIELIRRIQEDVYCEKEPVVIKKNHYKKLSELEKQDFELLGEQLKKIGRWWD